MRRATDRAAEVISVAAIAFVWAICVHYSIRRAWAAPKLPDMPPAQDPAIEWIGWPVTTEPYSGIDPGFYQAGAPPVMSTHTDVEIGLRSDGVVVWRRKPTMVEESF